MFLQRNITMFKTRNLAGLFLFFISTAFCHAAETTLNFAARHLPAEQGNFEYTTTAVSWPANKTALIICDVWDSHHSLNAVRRETELVPRIEQLANTLRKQGVLIIHSPSDCMPQYAEHPARQTAKNAPKAADLPADIHQWCRSIKSEDPKVYPIDQADGGEDDDKAELAEWHKLLSTLGRNPKLPWKYQHPGITIKDTDAISDSGVEIWNLLAARGINQVLICGVHTNMCVLGRPFGLRQLSQHGKKIVLVRDLTDTMYNPASRPFVSHYSGTSLIISHIERYVSGTVESTVFLNEPPIRFANDRRKLLMMIGEDEYKTNETLPEFAKTTLESLGYQVTIIHADKKNAHDFPGLAEQLPNHDALLISVRRRTPSRAVLAAIKKHLDDGKAVIGIRTASHAFAVRDPKKFEETAELSFWQDFDPAVLGGSYTNHYPVGPTTSVRVDDEQAKHPILRGVEVTKLEGRGSLYKVAPLMKSTTPLLFGTIPGKPEEPLAWTNTFGEKNARVFYTSLGHPGDFEQPAFRQLLVGGLTWATDRPMWMGKMADYLPKVQSHSKAEGAKASK
jgi:nicotinamidase-related amidase/type 1 glutamine amidotransferase